MQVTIIKQIESTTFEDIIVTALEGGSNYWYLIKDEIGHPKGTPPSTYIADKLWNDKKYNLNIWDAEYEDEDQLLGVITHQSCQDAFDLMALNHHDALNNILTDNYDANDADIFFQLAVMGEITFG